MVKTKARSGASHELQHKNRTGPISTAQRTQMQHRKNEKDKQKMMTLTHTNTTIIRLSELCMG